MDLVAAGKGDIKTNVPKLQALSGEKDREKDRELTCSEYFWVMYARNANLCRKKNDLEI